MTSWRVRLLAVLGIPFQHLFHHPSGLLAGLIHGQNEKAAAEFIIQPPLVRDCGKKGHGTVDVLTHGLHHAGHAV